jgi:protein SCO1/2
MNNKRNFLLGITIAVLIPLGFWFYYFFYKGLPKPLPKWFATGEVKTYKFRGATKFDSVYHTIADFKLTDQNGNIVTNDSFKDRIYVANFFFCSCPTICPIMIKNMKRLQDSYKDIKWLKLISHTVDPEHDSVPELKKYADKFGIDGAKWHLVTGDREQLYNLSLKSYFLAAQADGPENFDHSEKFVLVDNHRIIRGYYDGTDSNSVEKLNQDIVVLLKELSNDVNELRPPRK